MLYDAIFFLSAVNAEKNSVNSNIRL